MQATLYGTTEDVQKLLASLVAGQRGDRHQNGFVGQADETTKALLAGVGKGVADLAASAAQRLPAEPAPSADAIHAAE